MIMNEQLTKEEYEARKKSLNLGSFAGIESLRTRAAEYFPTQPQRYVQGEHNENSTGDHISNTKNSFCCMDCKDLEDCRYCQRVSMGMKSSMDYTFWGDNVERAYQCGACGNNVYNLKFSTMCTTNLSDSEYLDSCTGCKNCFGCVGLKKKEYCILNKQYTKKDYEALKAKLIAHMKKTPLRSSGVTEGQAGEYGEFFPKSMCSFAYNESIAMEYFPLSKEEVLKRGYPWRDETDEKPDVKKVIPAGNLPESIDGVPDDIVNWAVLSAGSSRPFRIVKQELNFYRAQNLPIPHLHPEERQARRTSLRPPRRLWKHTCGKCGKEVESTFSPERKEMVLCEECYLKEVY
jgi:CxxC-x17-CxxC domain-containing protein